VRNKQAQREFEIEACVLESAMPNHGAFSSARPGFAVRSLKKIGQRGLLSPYGSLGLASSDFLMIDSLSLATESSTGEYFS
jgi:hypothetical protein